MVGSLGNLRQVEKSQSQEKTLESYDERGVLTTYQSDLDILVVCDTSDPAKAEHHAQSVIIPKYNK